MASSSRIRARRSPLFAVNEEEPAEDGEVELADRHGPGPTPTRAGLHNKQMSVASVKFDQGNKGFLTKDEESARGMANKDGDVDQGAIVDLIAQNRAMKRGQRRLAGLSLFLLAALVVTGALLGARLDRATASTQVKIDEAATTEIARDAGGLPHLVDRASGGELTVRAEGDTFDTTQAFDHVTGRRLDCLPVHEAARMVNDLSHGVAGSVVEHDADGASKRIVSLAGDFEDHGRYLQFGSFRIVLDDDGCNRGTGLAPGLAPGEPGLDAAAGPAATGDKKGRPSAPAPEEADVGPGFVDTGPALEAAAAAAEGAAEGDGSETRATPRPSDADPFTRGLSRHAEMPEDRAVVLHRHRRAYDEAGTAIREGRQLFFGIFGTLDTVLIMCEKQYERINERRRQNGATEDVKSCSGHWEGLTGCTYNPYKDDMNWGEASLGFRATGSDDTCLENLRKGLEGCLNLSGKCVIDLSGPCGLEAKYELTTLTMEKQPFFDPTDTNIHRAELMVSATVSAEVRASFDFNMDIRANPHYKEQLIKIKFTAGYDLKSKFKLELEMPPSSTGTNHIGTFEAEYPLTRVPKNLFRRLFMMGPVPLLVEVDVQPMVWFDLITGSSSTLEFDINSSLEGEFEVQFDIDQLAFHTKQGLTGSPFTLENVKISGDFDATLSARAGARLTVSVNGQPVHLDAALALRLLLKIQPDVDFRQEPCLRGNVGFTSGLELRVSMESPANIAGKIKTGCTTAASFATPILGLMKSNMVTSCAADKIGWTDTSLTDTCNKMYDGIMNAEAFKDKCGAGMLFEDIPISAWVTIVGFDTGPLAAFSNGCPDGVVECPSDTVKGVTGMMAKLDKCMRKMFEAALPGLPSLSDTKACCPVANKMPCESCPCATGLKCVLTAGKKVCSDGLTNSACLGNSDCVSTSDYCRYEDYTLAPGQYYSPQGTCQAKYSLGHDCSKWAGSNLGYHAMCFSGYCDPATLKCASTHGIGATCSVDAACATGLYGGIKCICDEDIQQPDQCMTITIWPDLYPKEISFKIQDVCTLTGETVFSHDFSKVQATSLATDCVDRNAMCRDWAETGECSNNPDYMLINCRMSCVDDCPSRFKYCAPAGYWLLSISDTYNDGICCGVGGYGRWEVQYQGETRRGDGNYGAGTSMFIGNREENCPCTKRCGGTFLRNFGDAGDHCTTDTDCFSPNRCLTNLVEDRVMPSGPNMKCSRSDPSVAVRSVKISLPGDNKYLSLSEVQVFTILGGIHSGEEMNIARGIDSVASTSSIFNDLEEFNAEKAVDGVTTGIKDTTATNLESNPWWMVTFGKTHFISRIVVWNRQDCCPERLAGASVLLLDDNGVAIRSYPLVVSWSRPVVFDHTWWG